MRRSTTRRALGLIAACATVHRCGPRRVPRAGCPRPRSSGDPIRAAARRQPRPATDCGRIDAKPLPAAWTLTGARPAPSQQGRGRGETDEVPCKIRSARCRRGAAACACSGRSRGVHQQRSDRLERDRGVRGRGPTRTRAAAQLGDGAGRCLRRGQRDRRRPPALYRRARGRSVGFQAGGRGDRRLPDARRPIPDATGDAPAPL